MTTTIPAADLQPGDVFEFEGTPVTVTGIGPFTGPILRLKGGVTVTFDGGQANFAAGQAVTLVEEDS